jgi:hypothetical protein
MARPAVAAWLGDISDRLDLSGVARLWAAGLAGDPAFAESVTVAGPAFLDAVLDAALGRLDDENARRLAGTLLRLHCLRPAVEGARVRASLAALLAKPSSRADAALADTGVLAAARKFAPDLSAALVARAIPTGLRQAQRPDEFTRAAWALVDAARAGRAVR